VGAQSITSSECSPLADPSSDLGHREGEPIGLPHKKMQRGNLVCFSCLHPHTFPQCICTARIERLTAGVQPRSAWLNQSRAAPLTTICTQPCLLLVLTYSHLFAVHMHSKDREADSRCASKVSLAQPKSGCSTDHNLYTAFRPAIHASTMTKRLHDLQTAPQPELSRLILNPAAPQPELHWLTSKNFAC